MGSAASRGWRSFRSQPRWVRALVWVLALPVPVFIWALQRQTDRAPAVAFAIVITVGCIGIPLATTGSGTSAAATDLDTDRSETTTTVTPAGSNTATTVAATTSSASTTTSTTTAPPPETEPPSETAVTAPLPTQRAATDAAQLLSQLRVADEASGDGYDSDLFNYWGDANGDGCDTRCEVLAAERRDAVAGLPNGGWLSLYDATVTDDPSDLDIDHLVALAEAWRSGAWAWDAPRRAAFANDLDDPRSLIAVSAASNRSKSDSDPSGWRPPDPGYWCQYVTDWMAVKLRWDLSVDPIEFTALQHVTTETC